ncbi:PaaX domain-containing protein, C- domain protein [Streptomyces roseirectus]|uniref:PaaX domain-containing protein, C- domain protein n=1 Tax=Streptomyces roseirectus TaxID=2768066 RepID=A0A7H0I827_9ACTN|nr:PaaX family transcriptional regulator C-terminal domain-containing protein [Streptomyces roseirectus]QNP68943.1 PaaX domain-containing protein, C- domain protein [Streptomyces roseirectus]
MRRDVTEETGLRPLSARSVVLSLLLGAQPPELPVRELVRLVEPFGIGGSTLRAALSRMTTAGDLRRTGAVYGLSDRLLERRRRQDAALHPETRPWTGDWEMAVITTTGRPAAQRADLRAELTSLRLAELREGVWLRPANLCRPWPPHLHDVTRFTSRPATPPLELAATLWPLTTWQATAETLLHHATHATTPAARFTTYTAIVRHLRTDPALPTALLPPTWPADSLRTAYAAYREEFTSRPREGAGDRPG